MMRDREEIDADLGTFPPQESLCLSGVSSWLPKRRGPVGSLGDECLAPVLLLRILILRRFDTTTSAADIERLEHKCRIAPCESQCLNVPSSSVDRATRGIVSRLWVLVITSGLALLSDWEELDKARGRRLQTVQDKWRRQVKKKQSDRL